MSDLGTKVKEYFIPPHELSVYIKSTFDTSKTKSKLPKVTTEVGKKAKNILTITIQDTSNQKDLQELSNIMDSIHKLEKPLIEDCKKSILQ